MLPAGRLKCWPAGGFRSASKLHRSGHSARAVSHTKAHVSGLRYGAIALAGAKAIAYGLGASGLRLGFDWASVGAALWRQIVALDEMRTVRNKHCMSVVATILAELLGRPGDTLSLDEIAEVIGAAPVTFEDIDAVFDGLEGAGRLVSSEHHDPPAALARVLRTVRSFSAVSGRRPTLPEIAEHSGLSVGEVRFALLYARVLTR